MSVRGMKVTPLDNGEFRVRFNLTVGRDEAENDALAWAAGEMLDALPVTHQFRKLQASFERDRKGRESSRRIFLTLIGEKRPP